MKESNFRLYMLILFFVVIILVLLVIPFLDSYNKWNYCKTQQKNVTILYSECENAKIKIGCCSMNITEPIICK